MAGSSLPAPSDLLAQHPFLVGAAPEALVRAAPRARWALAGAGQIIVDFEDTSTDVYLIVQGQIRVLIRTADGTRTQILGDFATGDLVGEMAAIDGAARSAQVEALGRTRLCALPAAAFLDLVLSSPPVATRLLRLLTARLRLQTVRQAEQALLPSRLRLVAELLRLGRIRADGALVLSPPPTHEELAARIGLRRETVSREVSALARAGLLRTSRSAIVGADPAALRTLLQQAQQQRDPPGPGKMNAIQTLPGVHAPPRRATASTPGLPPTPTLGARNHAPKPPHAKSDDPQGGACTTPPEQGVRVPRPHRAAATMTALGRPPKSTR